MSAPVAAYNQRGERVQLQVERSPGRVKAAVQGLIAGWYGRDISPLDGEFWSRFFGYESWTGKVVTEDSALQLSTVWACVRLISETLSTLPVGLFRAQKDGSKLLDTDHSLYTLLHSQPNADLTAVEFWQVLIASMLLWGRANCEISRIGSRIVSLDFLSPDRVTWRWNADGSRTWFYNDPLRKRTRPIDAADMWHVMSFSTDGINGLSAVRYGINVLGSAMATDEASARTFRAGMRASGVITMEGVLQKDQREVIREHVNKVQQQGGTMVLEKGSSFQQLTMNPEDAQMLETRNLNVEEICRLFGVPPFMVGHASEGVTNWGTGIEQQTIGFVARILRPLAVRVEHSIRKNLLTAAERRDLSAEFALEGLLRGDSASRAAFYSQMVQNGVLTRDECRRLESRTAMGGNAAVLTIQSNLLPIDQLGKTPAPATSAQNALKAWLNIAEPAETTTVTEE